MQSQLDTQSTSESSNESLPNSFFDGLSDIPEQYRSWILNKVEKDKKRKTKRRIRKKSIQKQESMPNMELLDLKSPCRTENNKISTKNPDKKSKKSKPLFSDTTSERNSPEVENQPVKEVANGEKSIFSNSPDHSPKIDNKTVQSESLMINGTDTPNKEATRTPKNSSKTNRNSKKTHENSSAKKSTKDSQGTLNLGGSSESASEGMADDSFEEGSSENSIIKEDKNLQKIDSDSDSDFNPKITSTSKVKAKAPMSDSDNKTSDSSESQGQILFNQSSSENEQKSEKIKKSLKRSKKATKESKKSDEHNASDTSAKSKKSQASHISGLTSSTKSQSSSPLSSEDEEWAKEKRRVESQIRRLQNKFRSSDDEVSKKTILMQDKKIKPIRQSRRLRNSQSSISKSRDKSSSDSEENDRQIARRSEKRTGVIDSDSTSSVSKKKESDEASSSTKKSEKVIGIKRKERTKKTNDSSDEEISTGKRSVSSKKSNALDSSDSEKHSSSSSVEAPQKVYPIFNKGKKEDLDNTIANSSQENLALPKMIQRKKGVKRAKKGQAKGRTKGIRKQRKKRERKIMTKDQLNVDTRAALDEEEKRRKRLSEISEKAKTDVD